MQQRFVFIEAGNQAPCARHVALAVAQRADKGYASLFLQGQYLAIVLQKDECLGGNVAGLRAVGWSEDLFLCTLLVAIAIRVGKESELPLPSAMRPQRGSTQMSSMGEKVQFKPSADASCAAICALRFMACMSHEQESEKGMGNTVS